MMADEQIPGQVRVSRLTNTNLTNLTNKGKGQA